MILQFRVILDVPGIAKRGQGVQVDTLRMIGHTTEPKILTPADVRTL